MKNLFKLDTKIFNKFTIVGQMDIEQIELKGFSRSFAELEMVITGSHFTLYSRSWGLH